MIQIKNHKRKAINWNNIDNTFYEVLFTKQSEQYWLPQEIPVSDDKLCFELLESDVKETYECVLAGLTLLDTEQTVGITYVLQKVENLFQKSILGLFSGFESIHAKSYSQIFQTLCSSKRIDELFEWIEENGELQKKVKYIIEKYHNINNEDDLFIAMVGSLCLEGICFYSGFYLPLLLSGQGKMIKSGEIINLILRDEKLHTKGIGFFAQEELKKYTSEKQQILKEKARKLILEIYNIECEYTRVLYKKLDYMIDEVITYVKYNVDYSLECLGLQKEFNIREEEVNPIVMNGYSTETKTHDFFSTKGNGYIKTTKVEELDDSVFDV